MLQIAIWGMAIMLVVKGMDVLHQQAIARQADRSGSPILAMGAFLLAISGALFLVVSASSQASGSMDTLPSLTSYDDRGAAERAWDEASPETRARVEAMMADANVQMEEKK